jgi:hypothetical protein
VRKLCAVPEHWQLLERYPAKQPLPFNVCPLCEKAEHAALRKEFGGEVKPPQDARARYLVQDPIEVS